MLLRGPRSDSRRGLPGRSARARPTLVFRPGKAARRPWAAWGLLLLGALVLGLTVALTGWHSAHGRATQAVAQAPVPPEPPVKEEPPAPPVPAPVPAPVPPQVIPTTVEPPLAPPETPPPPPVTPIPTPPPAPVVVPEVPSVTPPPATVPADPAGNSLPADNPSSNLDRKGAEPAGPPAPPVPPAPVTVDEAKPVPTSSVEPPLAPEPVPQAPVKQAGAVEVEKDGVPIRQAPREETPMNPRWTKLGMTVAVAAALVSSPLAAFAGDSPSDDFSKLSVEKKLDELNKKITDLQDAVTKLRSENLALIEQNRKLIEANERISRLEHDLETLRTQMDSVRRSGFNANPANPAAPGNTGTIRLRNTYPTEVHIVVNDRTYQLLPGETSTLANQPAGNFTYEVLGIQPKKTVALAANDTFTITVFPR
jgi:hypothetical protein